ncbi:DUF2330 domain-containing protein [Robiginitomaculum antarcticum]|uniref:DUF2330 domain-containing protein n=1 Tax=Robiginitomaculum antarcticum TaxID=437507 RepID=UPI0003649CC9|nr:DUF2330 domain-containing protein [Robiginitomaculum antarcticum]
MILSKLKTALTGGVAMSMLAVGAPAAAFCGFYVAKADTDMFNDSSRVVMTRDGDRTVITMASDYEGDPTEFAMVIPVPTIVTKDQVHVSDVTLLDHLDAYTAPRLVEYHDGNPCVSDEYMKRDRLDMAPPVVAMGSSIESEAAYLGVTIEESFTVGEYDILILSARESSGLQTWLTSNGYKIPPAANRILDSYIKQDMKFFVAKINLEEQAKSGGEMLRPIAVAFESPKFMLPIRLGTVNSKGSQDMFVYALTRNGRVETTNYRTTKIPTDVNLPVFVEDDFDSVYPAMFTKAIDREGGSGVVMEYAWDMNWCDPCAADPLSVAQLRELGAFWVGDDGDMQRGGVKGQARDVFVTRLHVRYDAQSFPEDLKFQTTGNKENFQGRYVMQKPYDGSMDCKAADRYKKTVNRRQETEISTLANLTGWSKTEIRGKIDASGKGKKFDIDSGSGERWWDDIWGNKK